MNIRKLYFLNIGIILILFFCTSGQLLLDDDFENSMDYSDSKGDIIDFPISSWWHLLLLSFPALMFSGQLLDKFFENSKYPKIVQTIYIIVLIPIFICMFISMYLETIWITVGWK